MDGFEIPESYGALLLEEGGGDENVHGDSQMVGDGEVGAGQVADGDAGGADKVQNVSFFVGGEVYVLGEVEKVEYIQVVLESVESTWMLKSARSRTDGEMAQS